MRKVIVTGVALLALMAPVTGCSSSKKKSSGATKADLVKAIEGNKVSKDKATCVADKVYPQLSQAELNSLKNSSGAGSSSAHVTQVFLQAETDCGLLGASGTSGTS